MEQKSIEWYKARLGHITGSMVYCIMGKGRKKDEIFSETAKSYLYQVAAERNLAEPYLTDKFQEWLNRTNVETFAMKYGTENEDMARELYYINMPDGLSLNKCGFYQHPAMEWYGDSPDGIITDTATRVTLGCLEIKCPNPNTWMKYKALFKEGMTLREIEEKYYWQCQSHMMCTDTTWCDFVYFDKMQNDPVQVERVERNDEDIETLTERIILANEFIERLL